MGVQPHGNRWLAAGVLLLTRVIGSDVRTPDGEPVGRIADLTVSLN
jgi:hypothetical protein